MLGIIGFLTGPIGKFVDYAMIIIVLIGIAFGYLKLKEHEAVVAATLLYNQQQLEEVTKENQTYKDQVDKLQEQSDALIKENIDLNYQLQKKMDDTNTYIYSQKDDTLDPLFNSVLTKLKGSKN